MLQETFLSFWYWALSALLWAGVCNWTYGVPNELVTRAKRRGGKDAELFDLFARRNIDMISRAMDRGAAPWGAMVAFVMALLGTFAIRNNNEAAQGALFILVPLVLLGAVAAWRLQRIAKRDATPAEVLKLFLSERFRTAIVAGFAMVAAYAFTTMKHGAGWSQALFQGL